MGVVITPLTRQKGIPNLFYILLTIIEVGDTILGFLGVHVNIAFDQVQQTSNIYLQNLGQYTQDEKYPS